MHSFKSLRRDFRLSCPRIAILGLNPKAGDNGLLGSEEQEIILPAIDELVENGIQAFGPYPADTFFGCNDAEQFDGILAMYYEQGLAPSVLFRHAMVSYIQRDYHLFVQLQKYQIVWH